MKIVTTLFAIFFACISLSVNGETLSDIAIYNDAITHIKKDLALNESNFDAHHKLTKVLMKAEPNRQEIKTGNITLSEASQSIYEGYLDIEGVKCPNIMKVSSRILRFEYEIKKETLRAKSLDSESILCEAYENNWENDGALKHAYEARNEYYIFMENARESERDQRLTTAGYYVNKPIIIGKETYVQINITDPMFTMVPLCKFPDFLTNNSFKSKKGWIVSKQSHRQSKAIAYGEITRNDKTTFQLRHKQLGLITTYRNLSKNYVYEYGDTTVTTLATDDLIGIAYNFNEKNKNLEIRIEYESLDGTIVPIDPTSLQRHLGHDSLFLKIGKKKCTAISKEEYQQSTAPPLLL